MTITLAVPLEAHLKNKEPPKLNITHNTRVWVRLCAVQAHSAVQAHMHNTQLTRVMPAVQAHIAVHGYGHVQHTYGTVQAHDAVQA
jgi:hypothetical protein